MGLSNSHEAERCSGGLGSTFVIAQPVEILSIDLVDFMSRAAPNGHKEAKRLDAMNDCIGERLLHRVTFGEDKAF